MAGESCVSPDGVLSPGTELLLKAIEVGRSFLITAQLKKLKVRCCLLVRLCEGCAAFVCCAEKLEERPSVIGSRAISSSDQFSLSRCSPQLMTKKI